MQSAKRISIASNCNWARRFDLPVILHVRRSADHLLKGLREVPVQGGIAHAFNGSLQQARAFIALGFKLGFGGALTYERALQLRRLATELPLEALVLETDAPTCRRTGSTAPPPSGPQAPRRGATPPLSCRALPRCWPTCAVCRLADLARQTHANALQALPRLQGCKK